MILDEGDTFKVSGVLYEVMSRDNSAGGSWVKEIYNSSFHFFDDNYVETCLRNGLMHVVSLKFRPDPKMCHHTWARYTGAREVYNFCTNCDTKEQLDWKVISDGK